MRNLISNSLSYSLIFSLIIACGDDEGFDIGDPCTLSSCITGTWNVEGGGSIIFNADGSGFTTSKFFLQSASFGTTFTWVVDDSASTFTITQTSTSISNTITSTYTVASSNTNQMIIDAGAAEVVLTKSEKK